MLCNDSMNGSHLCAQRQLATVGYNVWQEKLQLIALQHFFICMSILMLKWVFTVKLSPKLINYERLQQMVCIIVFKNEWYVSNEKHMLLSSFSCPFWDRNQLPDPFFPSTCWITSYFNNPKMKTMKYCMMEKWAVINSGVRGSCSFSACWELHLSWQWCNSCLQHKYRSTFPKRTWDREVLQNFLPEVSSLYSVTARTWLITWNQGVSWWHWWMLFSGAWLHKKILCIPLVRPFSFQSTSVALLSFKNKTIALNTASERLFWNRSLDLEEQFRWQQCCNSFASKWLQPSSTQKLDQQSQRLHSLSVCLFLLTDMKVYWHAISGNK